ncbi:S24/S26 family peptidase [Mameliella sp. AT18]|uniref:S24 family peptidase n=1 Tax=Mameliella sp. AT18 TaxID=3028385 RepID=UPI00237B1936|nr:S24/S26 family peptidase [Mameliella sp. AT18]MDD9731881.1 S24/S26 family peptidase [Mameliella sp. AT18]
MSASAASQKAVGNPSFIKNLKNRRSEQGRPHAIESLQALAEVLGLEFYIGPPRATEATAELDGERFATIARYEASAAAGHGVVNLDAPPKDHLAVPRDWMIETGIRPDRCILITAKGESMAPAISNGDLVMIDRHRKEITSGKLYVYNDPDNGTRIKRLEFIPGAATIIARSDNPDQKRYPPEYHTGPAMNAISQNILGEVVWSGHLWR